MSQQIARLAGALLIAGSFGTQASIIPPAALPTGVTVLTCFDGVTSAPRVAGCDIEKTFNSSGDSIPIVFTVAGSGAELALQDFVMIETVTNSTSDDWTDFHWSVELDTDLDQFTLDTILDVVFGLPSTPFEDLFDVSITTFSSLSPFLDTTSFPAQSVTASNGTVPIDTDMTATFNVRFQEQVAGVGTLCGAQGNCKFTLTQNPSIDSVAAAPEPGTALLFGAGLLGLLRIRRA